MSSFDEQTLAAIKPLREAGFALHWLHAREKRPVGREWQDAPVASLADLHASHQPGYNLGVRLGSASALSSGGYLHVLDIDIRIPELADEALAALAALFPNTNVNLWPCVASGSGGASRHLYFITDVPYRSRKIAKSEGKHRRTNAEGRQVWSHDWEIEIFGTGKQVVLPPSIHPDTGRAYSWLRPFDFGLLNMGLGPYVAANDVNDLVTAESTTYQFESREPLTFADGQFERVLSAIDLSAREYDDWLAFGQAIHHQTGASEDGWKLWLEHSRKSEKHVAAYERKMRQKWRSFGKYRGTPVTMASIVEWAKDARVARLISEMEEEPGFDINDMLGGGSVVDPFDDLTEAAKPAADGWITLMHLNEDGAIKPTLHNLRLIVEHDKWTAGVPAFNQFTQEIVQRGIPGTKQPKRKNPAKPVLQLSGPSWVLDDPVNGDFWTDDKDNAIRALIEAPETQGGYGIKVPDRDLRAAVDIVGRKNGFHPVREYLTSLPEWDGVSRAERLFVDYLGAPDDAYTREVASKMLTAAVARVFEPGIKFDFAVILMGLQGKRKSTFIQTLAKDWFVELDGDFNDSKLMVETMQGAWILELAELGGFVRAEVQHIKSFISKQSDKVRLSYAKRAQKYHRQCIFIGSTNDQKFLKDNTGNRRFWPILCHVDQIDTDRLVRELGQIWAEALHLYRAMRAAQPRGGLPLYLTDREAKAIALMHQEAARVETAEDGLAGTIHAWLEKPIVTGSLDDDGDEPRVRNETCLMELWVEALGKNKADYDQKNAQQLGRAIERVPGDWKSEGRFITHKIYGRQRAIDRGGYKGRLARDGLLRD